MATTRGVVLCHGHAQGMAGFPYYLPQNINWTFMDVNPGVRPDVVGDYHKLEDLQVLGLYSWDIVLNKACPVYANFPDMAAMVNLSRWLLRPEGKFLFPKLIRALITKVYATQYIQYGEDADARSRLLTEWRNGMHPELASTLHNLAIQNHYIRYEIMGEDVIFYV